MAVLGTTFQLQYFFIYCLAAIVSTHAAFVPTTSITSTNIRRIFSHQRRHTLYSSNPNSSSSISPLSNIQEALSDIDKLKTALSTSSSSSSLDNNNKLLQPTPPSPLPFDPTNPEALIAITKSFIATDFGIQSSQLPDYSTGPKKTAQQENNDSTTLTSTTSALPYYSSSLLSQDFIWVSANNINDGRAGILNKAEYLAAGQFFNLRQSFPDLEYRPHDFRIVLDESLLYNTPKTDSTNNAAMQEITVRFTTLAVGTFRGKPLRLRSRVLQPNGKVMRCPPTSVSITYATRGENAGKIIKLVNDMVLDRQFGNTNGLSGIAGAAVIGDATPSDWEVYPPFVCAGRVFARPMKMIQERDEDDGYLPPFPDSVMIQLAKGITASNFGLEDSDLLSNEFTYLEPLMGPMDKERYIKVFSEFNVREAVPDLDYQFQNYRIDPYDPYRVYIDTRARGTRTGAIGNNAAPISPSIYLAPPETMSLTFDNDGFCTRMTFAAPLDPLLGNTGLLGGVYGLLYATDTPENPLKTRTFNLLLNRAQKVALKAITKAEIDEYRLSDGRVITGNKPIAQLTSSSSSNAISTTSLSKPPKLPSPPAIDKTSNTPFFAAQKSAPETTLPPSRTKTATTAIPKSTPAKITPTKSSQNKPESPKQDSPIKTNFNEDPQDPVTDAFSSFFGTSEVTSTSTKPEQEAKANDPTENRTNKVNQLRQAAAEARKEAAEAKQRAAEQKAMQAKAAAEQKAKLNSITPVFSKAASESPQVFPGPDKRSPTLSIFGSLPGSSPVNSQKSTSEVDASVPKKSPTFTLFGSAPTNTEAMKSQPQSAPPAPKRSPTLSLFKSTSVSTPSPSPQKKSPTLSIFGSSSKEPVPSKTPKKQASKGAMKKSQSFSIAGVGGGKISKKSTKKKPKEKVSTKKAVVKKEIAIKGTARATFSLFQGSGVNNSASVEKELPKKAASKSPTFSLFQGPEETSSKAKVSLSEPKKSPTLSLLKGAAKTKQGPAKSNSKDSGVAASTSKSKLSSSSDSVFGGFFGGGRSNSSKKKATLESKGSLVKPKPSSIVGVPTLKQWKVNPDNSIEARIYGSGSFKDGEAITTSPIGKKFKVAKGNVVQTSSGSKYLLS